MTAEVAPRELLEPRLTALIEHLPAALEGRAVAVHQARVASRRLREALPVIGALGGRRRTRTALRAIRGVTRALGPVRELDVTLDLIDTVASAHPELATACRSVRRRVVSERRARREDMLGSLGHGVSPRARKALGRVASRLDAHPDLGAWSVVITARAQRRSRRFAEAIGEVGLLFDPAGLHRVRIAAKKLRYALELAAETGALPVAEHIPMLKRVQETLGRLHDLQVLLAFVRAGEIDVPPRLHAGLAALRDHLEQQCHREHAKYLRRRPGLLDIPGKVVAVAEAQPAASRPGGHDPRRGR
jgi:CHAD domain-containing protein